MQSKQLATILRAQMDVLREVEESNVWDVREKLTYTAKRAASAFAEFDDKFDPVRFLRECGVNQS